VTIPVGNETSHVGYRSSPVGLKTSVVGNTTSPVGFKTSVVGYATDRVGITTFYVGLFSSAVGNAASAYHFNTSNTTFIISIKCFVAYGNYSPLK